jgi:hypothetical protein
MSFTHSVFFELEDGSPAAVEDLLRGCREELAGHEGEEGFFAGARAAGYEREVNDLAFHVALVIRFTDRAAHDAYQVSDRHARFIERCQGNWRGVRVFDAEG